MLSRRKRKRNQGSVLRLPIFLGALGCAAILVLPVMGHASGRLSIWGRGSSDKAQISAGVTPPVAPAQPVAPPTNPSAPPVVTQAVKPKLSPQVVDLSSLQKDLQAFVDQQSGTYGIHVVDLSSGRSVGVNSDETFPAASTIKLPMAMYILEEASQGRVDLDERLAYSESDWEEGTGILQGDIVTGDTYTVKELVSLAISHSDNIATNILMRRFERQNIFAYVEKLGGKVHWYDEETVGTSPREMALFMQQAYTKRRITNPTLQRYLMDTLAHTEFHDRVEEGVPNGVKVAHKIGTLPGVVNDVAIVYAPERSFVLSVFSRDVDEEVAPSVIAEMTKLVYNYESRLMTASKDQAPGIASQ